MDVDSLLAILVGAAVTLGGVWLGQRGAAREAQRSRAEARREGQRRVVTDLLIAGKEKARLYQVLLPAFGKLRQNDLVQFLNTDLAKSSATANAQYDRAVSEARLFVGDPALAEPIAKLAEIERDFPDAAVGPAMKAGESGSLDGVLAGLRHVSTMRAALDLVETAAIDVLRMETAEPEASSGRRMVQRFQARFVRRSKADSDAAQRDS